MQLRRLFFTLLILMCCLSFTPSVSADDSSTQGSSNELLQGLMGFLQEGIDEFIGSYKGRLGDVKLIERRGNKIILEVTYDNIKRSDNVHVQGEVRYFGAPLEGFSNTLNTVSGSHGKVKLAIGWSQKEDDGWGIQSDEVKSDQIRLFLVRKSNPDRPFGEIFYDMPKTWTQSDEPDEESLSADSDVIELEDDGAGEEAEGAGTGNKPKPGVFVKPGTVLVPNTKLTATPAVVQPATSAAPATAGTTATKVRQRSHGVTSYDFYENAKSAKWRSAAGNLPFPGAGNDKRGFVRRIPKGRLNSGHAAVNMLQTHPSWDKGGWIEGRFPFMILDDNIHFKSVAGLLQGADQSDGAIFQVYIMENGKAYRVDRKKITAKTYASIDADLSKWSGKKVQILLRVRSRKTTSQDWAVWVKPRLTK